MGKRVVRREKEGLGGSIYLLGSQYLSTVKDDREGKKIREFFKDFFLLGKRWPSGAGGEGNREKRSKLFQIKILRKTS